MKYPIIGAIILAFFASFILYYTLSPNNYEIENCDKHFGTIESINQDTKKAGNHHWDIRLKNNPKLFSINENAYSCVNHQLFRKELKIGQPVSLYTLQESKLKLLESWNKSNNHYAVLEIRANEKRLLKIEEVKEVAEMQAVPWSFFALALLVCAGWVIKRHYKKQKHNTK